jgi:hypothetical protein
VGWESVEENLAPQTRVAYSHKTIPILNAQTVDQTGEKFSISTSESSNNTFLRLRATRWTFTLIFLPTKAEDTGLEPATPYGALHFQ